MGFCWSVGHLGCVICVLFGFVSLSGGGCGSRASGRGRKVGKRLKFILNHSSFYFFLMTTPFPS
jgi:hypothetical protein